MCLSWNSLVAPKLTDAITGFLPSSFSASVCHEIESFPFRYRFIKTVGQHAEKPTRKQAHLVFADTQSQTQKTKRACFFFAKAQNPKFENGTIGLI